MGGTNAQFAVGKGKQPQIRVSGLNSIPIRQASKPEQLPLAAIAKKITGKKRENPQADTSALEREIDELVDAFYGLTAEEIKIVEETAK